MFSTEQVAIILIATSFIIYKVTQNSIYTKIRHIVDDFFPCDSSQNTAYREWLIKEVYIRYGLFRKIIKKKSSFKDSFTDILYKKSDNALKYTYYIILAQKLSVDHFYYDDVVYCMKKILRQGTEQYWLWFCINNVIFQKHEFIRDEEIFSTVSKDIRGDTLNNFLTELLAIQYPEWSEGVSLQRMYSYIEVARNKCKRWIRDIDEPWIDAFCALCIAELNKQWEKC